MIIDELGPPPEEFIPHVPRALSPMVRRIPTSDSRINTYLIGIDEILVLNPGPQCSDHFAAISGCGGERLKWVASTSTGKSYAGGKTLLAKELGLKNKNLKPGDILQSTEFKLRCFDSSDGAKKESLFFLEEERVLFCNDLLASVKGDTIYETCVNLAKKLRPKRIAPAQGQIIEDFGVNLGKHLSEILS